MPLMRRASRQVSVCCVTLGLALAAHAQPSARGTLLIVGGSGKARIAVFAMASEEGLTGGEEKAADLRALGARAVNVWLTHAQATTDSAARLLNGVTGIWFGGGDQVRLANVLRGTATLRAIRARYAAGAVVGGTSAGAAVLSTPMITGDERSPGGARPPGDSTDHWLTIARNDVVTDAGFDFVQNAIVDQHFVRRRRQNRLLSLVLESHQRLGVGIDESTALRIGPDGIWHVLGASVAVIVDARKARVTPQTATLGASGLVMHVLPAGSSFDPRGGSARLP
ncbi:MAG: cyanophycinase [Gemmatimonadaceae bacterium]|nr:cyanophycinase [Gemmatimonadaceae bacterium]